jgi:GAF domain-containing protein
MVPADITPLETRQFELLIRKSGASPSAFALRKFRYLAGTGYKVRVVGRGAATVYDVADPTSWMGQFAQDLEKGLFGNDPAAELPPHVQQALAQVSQALAHGGLPQALSLLNARVPHRFTAVYRLVGQSLHNVATHDKHLHLEPPDLKVVPLKDSFCQYVLRDSLFVTCDSGNDVRLDGHPYRGIVGSYVGVPIRERGSRLAGTLCHFDLESHEVSDDEYLLLDQAARLMPAFLAS